MTIPFKRLDKGSRAVPTVKTYSVALDGFVYETRTGRQVGYIEEWLEVEKARRMTNKQLEAYVNKKLK